MSHYKQYPAYKRSNIPEISLIPEGWSIKPLKHHADFFNSNVDKKSYEDGIPTLLCNYTDVYYNEFISPDLPFMEATASESEVQRFTLKAGDVIITKDSEDPWDIGVPAMVKEDMPGVVCGYHLTMIRAKDLHTSRFIHRLLQSLPVKSYLAVNSPGITRFGLGQDVIGSLPVPTPPTELFKTIADKIDRETTRIDALIAKKTRFIDLLKEKRQALITHAVTKGLNPNVKMKDSGVEWIGEVPEHWECGSLGYYSTIKTGGTPDRKNEEYWAGNIPWVKTGEVNYRDIYDSEEKITEEGLANSSAQISPPGTILMAMYGMGVTRGRVAMLAKGCAYNQACAAISCSTLLSNTYLYRCLEAAYNAIRDLGNEASQINLNIEIISKIKIPVPPLVEQNAIVQKVRFGLSKVDTLIQQTNKSIALLKERRSAFITAAVTGQIDLRSEVVQ